MVKEVQTNLGYTTTHRSSKSACRRTCAARRSRSAGQIGGDGRRHSELMTSVSNLLQSIMCSACTDRTSAARSSSGRGGWVPPSSPSHKGSGRGTHTLPGDGALPSATVVGELTVFLLKAMISRSTVAQQAHEARPCHSSCTPQLLSVNTIAPASVPALPNIARERPPSNGHPSSGVGDLCLWPACAILPTSTSDGERRKSPAHNER
mmetsp:Transcript_12791/g.17463  ORF Transcript_12791/g.17463 Transcript_12791/m.17463 type:complete len:207 (-) Transcript_12791:107-727(-)